MGNFGGLIFGNQRRKTLVVVMWLQLAIPNSKRRLTRSSG